MCFSATASFTAGAVLSAVGVVTIKKAKSKRALPFAVIPLLFGMQQVIEGAVWLSFNYGLPFLNQIATYSFLFFAYILWPIFVPFAVGLLESDTHRKKILYGFQLIGIVVSLYLSYFAVTHQIVSKIINQCIAYTMPPVHGVVVVGFYILAVGVSCIFSSHRIVNIFGILVVFSFALTYYFFTTSFVSVWCFFAAILSAIVYWYFSSKNDSIGI